MIHTFRSGASFLAQNDLSTILREFNRRDTHPFLQFFKYGLCGVIAVITHMTVFYLLAYSTFLPSLDHSLVDGQLISDALRARNASINNFLGWSVANAVAYFLNVLWVFEPGRHHKWIEFGLFTLVSFIAFLGGILGGPLLIRLVGISTHLAQVFFVITSALVNYICRKFFIFEG